MADNRSPDHLDVMMRLTPDMNNKLQYLAKKLDCEVNEVISYGINLLGAVTEANGRGCHLGFCEDPEKLDQMIEGLPQPSDA